MSLVFAGRKQPAQRWQLLRKWLPRRQFIKSPEPAFYKEVLSVLQNRCHADALEWIMDNLRPEAARMLEACLASYGPAEAARWVQHWEQKQEPIAREDRTDPSPSAPEILN